MLYLSLVLSMILLLIANVAAHRRGWLSAFFCVGLAFSLGPLLLMILLPSVALLFLGLAIALLPRYFTDRRPWLFLPASGVVAVIVWVLVLGFALKQQQEYAHLREQFPYESMEERLSAGRPIPQQQQLSLASDQQLAEVEWLLEQPRTMRLVYLKKLHEDTTALFVNNPGFGVARTFRPSQDGITSGLRSDPPVEQPEPRTSAAWLLEAGQWEPRSPEAALYQTHQGSVLDFANPQGFGFFKDRRHVAGFQAHQFSRLPESAKPWTVRRVELVGLLMHEQPVAYVSEHLPRMDELRKAPTRSLDGFETSGLARLRQGEDLVVGETSGRVQMLGAIRSAKQCLGCHEGARGDLLGAFSYSLRRSDP
jgi:hypothetical protein